MKKALIALVIALVLVSVAGLVLFASDDVGAGRGGRGFGAQGAGSASESRSVWLWVFAVPLGAALVGVAYLVAFPEIKTTTPKDSAQTTVAEAKQESQALEAVLRVLNEDEKKVVQALAETKEGAMLQKDIRWKVGMTRVKTHRVLARLSARGIVKAEKHYNTNKIRLSNWIATNTKKHQQQPTQTKPPEHTKQSTEDIRKSNN